MRLSLLILLLGLCACKNSEPLVPIAVACSGEIAEYPEKAASLLANLNLDYPGLEAAKLAFTDGDHVAAINALMSYYRQNPGGQSFRETEITPITINQPIKDYLIDRYTILGFQAKVPRTAAGFLDWKHVPDGTTSQFVHFLNRFVGLSHWVRAAHQTQNATWRAFLNNTLCDWVLSNPYRTDRLAQPLEEESRSYEFGGNNNYPWLILNAGVRVRAFQLALYQMLENDLIEPGTFLLLLSSIEEHSDYLYSRGGFNGDNWDNITLDALLKISVGFPEFKRSTLFKEAAADRYLANLQQVWYPDGSQWELATHYGYNVLNNSVNFFSQLQDAGIDISPEMIQQQKDQIFYQAVTADPEGYILPANDSDPNRFIGDKIAEFARDADHQEALFLATKGQEGIIPHSPASRFFDYSGNLLSRDSWDATQQYSCFDIGPFGMGHNHADKLSLTIYNGRKLLVDPGRFTYGSNNEWATYRKSTPAHNSITIDGANQKMLDNNGAAGLPGAIDDYLKNNPRSFLQVYDMARDTPIPGSEYALSADHDFARGRVMTGYEGAGFAGKAVHERGVWYQRGEFWLVVDRIFSDRDRQVEAFWHFHPDCRSVAINLEGAVLSQDPAVGNLILIPIEGTVLPTGQLIRGQETPEIRGWYSAEFNDWEPATDAVFTANVGRESVFGWLIVPFESTDIPQASAAIIHLSQNEVQVEITTNLNPPQIIHIPLEEPPVF